MAMFAALSYLVDSQPQEAEGYFGAGTGPVYALLDKTHKYLARGAVLDSAPLNGWTLKSKKVKILGKRAILHARRRLGLRQVSNLSGSTFHRFRGSFCSDGRPN